jgi:hypothetical protein
MEHQKTNITAGELRALGLTVQADVPNCAVIPRWAIRIKSDSIKVVETEKGLEAVFSVETTEPFRWCEVTINISEFVGLE